MKVPARFRDQFELVHRHRASRPNGIWQADHTQLDLSIRDASGKPVRPWLTTVIDDHSRALAGYSVFVDAPSAFQTSLALRQSIWRKADPLWAVCGIPDVLYVDHGSDFTSKHLEQVAVGPASRAGLLDHRSPSRARQDRASVRNPQHRTAARHARLSQAW